MEENNKAAAPHILLLANYLSVMSTLVQVEGRLIKLFAILACIFLPSNFNDVINAKTTSQIRSCTVYTFSS